MRFSRRLGFGAVRWLGAWRSSPVLRRCTSRMRLLFRQLQRVHGLSDAQMTAIRKIFAKSGIMGQGNPAVTRHPVTPEEAQAKLKQLGIDYANPRFEKICGAKYMAPLYDLPRKSRKTRRPASTSSSSPIFPLSIPWSG